jgi:peptide subunit release factor 1 (eRF1)
MFRSRTLRQRRIVSTKRQLITCPACDSTLIQIECCHPVEPESALLERHCPECGHRDDLVVAMVVADVLAEHAAELATSLEELADCLEAASELWLSR